MRLLVMVKDIYSTNYNALFYQAMKVATDTCCTLNKLNFSFIGSGRSFVVFDEFYIELI